MSPAARRLLLVLFLGPAVVGLVVLPSTAVLAQVAVPATLAVTGYVVEGTPVSVVDREAPALSTLSVDGVNLRRGGGSVTRPDAGMTALLRRAHHDGLRAELLLGNYDDGIGDFSPAVAARLLRHPSRRAAVARQAAGIVRSQGWDGVAVDLESLRRADAPGLTAFVAALQARLPARRTVSVCLMATTSAAGYRDLGYRLPTLAQRADRLALMAYDEHGPGWSGAGPVGGLRWQRASLAALLSRVPARKVDLGVGGYGYGWATSGAGSVLTVRAARAAAGSAATWVPAQGEWTATLPDGTVLWWSDARSWDRRVTMARNRGLHGMALWRIGSADPLPHPEHAA